VSGQDKLDVWPVRETTKVTSDIQRRTIVGAARAAEATNESGELVVRRGTLVGRILFVDGKVAWIHCHGINGYLTDLLVKNARINPGEITQVLDQARRSGVPLGEALVAAGRLTTTELKKLLLTHVQQQLGVLLNNPDPVAVLFLPVKRKYSGEYLFGLDDVLGEVKEQLSKAPSLGAKPIVTLLTARLFAVRGAIGCGAVVTGEGRATADVHTHHATAANEQEIEALAAHSRRIAGSTGLLAELAGAFAPIESVQVATDHYVYERPLPGVIVFVMARAVEPLGAFTAAARGATRDLMS
jgi:hypothetical protein